MVGPAELRKRKDENKTPIFRVRFTFKSSPLSESLEQATLHTPLAHLPNLSYLPPKLCIKHGFEFLLGWL